MKKRLSLVLILVGFFSIILSYAGANAYDNMPFRAFNLADYNINKKLSVDELTKEIVAYSHDVLQRVYACSDDGTFKDNNDPTKKNENFTNHCSDLHASDYLRLSYLYFINSIHTLPATEVLHYVLPDSIAELVGSGWRWYGDSDIKDIEWTSAPRTIENWWGGKANFYKNINFITNNEALPTDYVITMLGDAESMHNYIYSVASSVRACNLFDLDRDQYNKYDKKHSQRSGEEQRKIFLNGEQAIENCKQTVYAEQGKPMEEETRKACREIENELIHTKFDVKESKDGKQIFYKSTGDCAKDCQKIWKEGCDKGDCNANCGVAAFRMPWGSEGCGCDRICRAGSDLLCNDDYEKTRFEYFKIINNRINPNTCTACTLENMQKQNPACIRTAAQEEELLKLLETCKISGMPPLITCLTTTNILHSTTGKTTTKKILDNVSKRISENKRGIPDKPDLTLFDVYNPKPKWLPLTDQEKDLMGYDDDFADLNDTSIDLRPRADSICSQRGFGALVCIVVRFLSSISDGVFKFLEGMLIIPTKVIATGTVAEAPNYAAWDTFRNIANIILVIITVILILAQITGYKPETYSLKRTLPILILAAILVNLSYYFCQIAVDLSNIIGGSIKQSAEGLAKGFSSEEGLGIAKHTADILMYGLTIGTVVAGVIAAAFVGLAVLIPLIFSVLITSLMTLLVLAFRQLIVTVMVVLSPIAFALIALPSARSFFSRWLRIFVSGLAVYPIVAVLFSSGKLAHDIMVSSVDDPGLFIKIFAIIVVVLPLFALPTVLSRAMKAMPIIGGRVQNLLSGVSKRATSRLMQTTPMQSIKQAEDRKRQMDKEGKSRPSWKNPLRRIRSDINRKLINRMPIYRDVRGAMAAIDPERWEQIQSIARGFDKNESNEYLLNASQGKFDGVFDQDKLMAAILTSSSQGDSSHETIVKALDQARSKYGIEESYVNQAMTSAMANYLSEGEMAEYAMFKAHRDLATSQVSGFSLSYDDFNSHMDDTAKRNAIKTELIRTPVGRIPKFKGYESLKPSDSLAKRLAKEVIEGYTDGGITHKGLFEENEFWREDALKNSQTKEAMTYMKNLQRRALKSYKPPGSP